MSSAGNGPEREEPQAPDIELSLDRSGEFYLVRPVSERGRSWLRRNIPPAALTPEGDLVVAPHYASDLVAWMRTDGLRAILPEEPPA